MTDTAAPSAREKVLPGSLLALLAIPLGIVAYAIVGGILGDQISFVLGAISAFLPGVAALLYRKASGGTLKAGKVPVVLISIVAIVLGVGAGLVATVWSGFSGVNHQSGIFSAAFATTFASKLTSGSLIIQLLIGLGLGVVGVLAMLRTPASTPSPTAAPLGNAQADAVVNAPLPPGTAPAGTPLFGDAVAPPAAPVAPSSNAPSPGILLNGKPLDPKADKKK